MNRLLSAWLVESILITYRGTKQGKFTTNPVPYFPLPSEYVATVLVFGGLSLLPSNSDAGRVAGVIGWGLVVATALNLWNPASSAESGIKPTGISTAPATITPKKAGQKV